MQSNIPMNEITIEGSNKTNVEKLMQKIQYVNNKEHPTIGRRNIQVHTTITCPNKKAIRLPTIDTYIMVNSADDSIMSSVQPDTQYTNVIQDKSDLLDENKPQIVISGNTNHLVSYPDIKDGVRILAKINISVVTGGKIQPDLQKLESCSVNVFPNLNPDHEEILVDNDEYLSPTLDIKTSINKDGVEMIGFDSIENYLQVLKSLVYANKKPAYYLNRVFKLICSQVESKFRSSEFTLTLTVLHPKQQPTPAPVQLSQQHHGGLQHSFSLLSQFKTF
jgi:calsyntenin 1